MQSIRIDPFSTLDLGSHTLTLTGTFDPASLPLPSNSVPLAFDTITGTGTIKLQPAATGQSIEIGTNCGFTAKVIPNLIMGPITANQTVTLGHNGCKAIFQVNGDFISGTSPSAMVSFVKGDTNSNITNAVTSYYCASNGGITNITCESGGPPAGYSSTPVSGSALNISGTQGSSPITDLIVIETGNADLVVTMTFTGADASKFFTRVEGITDDGFSIADGDGQVTVGVECNDASVGTFSATLNVAHNATGSPATYPLSCTISNSGAGGGTPPSPVPASVESDLALIFTFLGVMLIAAYKMRKARKA